jgi:hypothetical protein
VFDPVDGAIATTNRQGFIFLSVRHHSDRHSMAMSNDRTASFGHRFLICNKSRDKAL